MNQKLTDQQIEELFTFCSKHKVEFYDLQIELVDHLAAGIEESMALQGRLSFEEALSVQFKEFGDKGFSGIIRNKRRTLNRKYSNLQWRLVGEFFKFPKILLTLVITLTVFAVFLFSNNNIEYSYFFFLNTLLFCYIVISSKKRFKLDLVSEKKFLLHSRLVIFQQRLVNIGYIPCYYLIIEHYFNLPKTFIDVNIYVELIVSFLITFYFIFLFVAINYVPKRIKEDFEKEFPEFVKTSIVST